MSERTNTGWTLTASTAQLGIGPWTARLDLTQPRRGLHDWKCGDATLGSSALLGLELPLGSIDELSLPETYVRGSDLVTAYSATAARPWRVQAYWRAIDGGVPDAVVVELQVSINTGLLDVRPAVDVMSRLVGGERRTSTDGRFGLALAAGWDYWQAVHPDDPSTPETKPLADGVQLRERLFDRFLEKGVILRSRIRAAIVPSGCSVEEIFREFAAAPLPLTT